MRKIFRVLSLAVLIALCGAVPLASCSSKNNPVSDSESDYKINFFLKDQKVAVLGLTDLHRLSNVTLQMAGKNETGVTLPSVLELAGISNYSEVQIKGMLKGRLATGQLTLKLGDITNEVLLSYNNQGKTKLCGTKIPDSNWIIDVAEIRAQ